MKNTIPSIAFLLLAISTYSQDFSKPDFPFTEDRTIRKAQTKLIPDTYLIFFDETEMEPFIFKNPAKDNDNRETRGNVAKSYENQMIVAIRKLAQEKLGITPAMIQEYYTTANVGIKVQIKNTNAKGLADKLKTVQEVGAIVQDYELNALYTESRFQPSVEALRFNQYPSWGINIVGTANYSGNKWAWVLDTGIDPTHTDLNVMTNSTYAVSFITGESTNDGNGHGTHVAGIIAAKNNSFGTVGVAAGALVIPVKVLSNSGSGSYSSILSGVNHVAKYCIAGDVVNMSLGGPAPDWFTYDTRNLIEKAIINLGNAGVHCVLAAGNDKYPADRQTPARINGNRIYTISAMDWNKEIASFSNYGNPPVDYAAPGAWIISTWPGAGSNYKYLDGTSMAAPFVSGILLVNNGIIRTNGTLVKDWDWTKDPIAIK